MLINVGFQLIIALPFTSDSVAFALGFKNGAKTPLSVYLARTKLLGGDGERAHGAYYMYTIYWQFVGKTIYNSPMFLKALTLCILGSNVYFFFLR